MELKTSFFPKFNSNEIYQKALAKQWMEIQTDIYELGDTVLKYLQDYINNHAHRKPNSGLLSRSMEVRKLHGPAVVGFMIGEIAKLPAYWHIINYGGMTTASLQNWTIRGYFGQGNAPDSSKAGSGIGDERFHTQWNTFAMSPKSPIKPMNYIEATDFYIEAKMKILIMKAIKG